MRNFLIDAQLQGVNRIKHLAYLKYADIHMLRSPFTRIQSKFWHEYRFFRQTHSGVYFMQQTVNGEKTAHIMRCSD